LFPIKHGGCVFYTIGKFVLNLSHFTCPKWFIKLTYACFLNLTDEYVENNTILCKKLTQNVTLTQFVSETIFL